MESEELVLMRWDISAYRVTQYGPFYRPYDGQEVLVQPRFVARMRDKGWQIVKQKKES